jgi:hypothetical protein
VKKKLHNPMPTIDLEEVLELQTERVAKVGAGSRRLFGHVSKDMRIELEIAALREITAGVFALAAHTTKKESQLPELEKMWSMVLEICDLVMARVKKLIAKARTPVSLADFERFQEAARFRADLYRKPAT